MRRHRLLQFAACSVAVLGAGAISVPAYGDPPRVVAIEEHWELQISQPDSERSAPQITMVMSPTPNLNGTHFLVTLNQGAESSGGVHVQLYDGTELVESRTAEHDTVLNHDDETIRWVQRITLQDGTLSFAVVNGESESWGAFGGDDLSLSLASSQNALNTYRPAVSLTESQVGYAENRVVSLVLKKLVWTTEDGQVHEQNAPIPIDTSLDE